MARQECSLIALSMPGAEHQRGHRPTVGPEDPARRGPGSDIMAPEGAARRGSGSDIMAPEGGFRAEIFFNREIYTSRRGIPLKMGNFVRVLSNFAPKALPVRAPGSYFVGPEGVPPPKGILRVGTFCPAAHSARQKTKHHPNSALVGEYP